MNAKLLLGVLLSLCAFCFTGCGEKDDEGYYLSPNYATATINGEEYIYRERSLYLPRFGHYPSVESYYNDFYVGEEVIDVTPVLHIFTPLKAVNAKKEDETYYELDLFIKHLDIEDISNGQTFNFSVTSMDNLYGESHTLPFERMWRENINIAVLQKKLDVVNSLWETTASGSVTFSNLDKEKKSFTAVVELKSEGEEPIELQGNIYLYYI